MSFADPQSVTINAVPYTLPRTGSGINSGSFATNDSTVKLGVSSQYGKRVRRTIRLDHSKYATDPTNSALQVPRSMSVYIVADVPLQGYSVTEQKQIVDGLVAYLTASTGAQVAKLLGGEN
uniref:Uncharacterized protein n=1 Tax=Leviviridae sp. TaxID=2027243 RepID=A0A514DC00_9VIRU|nr:MAG: hypothetical protein H3Bulk41384_000003 [Leviviridae sp.]